MWWLTVLASATLYCPDPGWVGFSTWTPVAWRERSRPNCSVWQLYMTGVGVHNPKSTFELTAGLLSMHDNHAHCPELIRYACHLEKIVNCTVEYCLDCREIDDWAQDAEAKCVHEHSRQYTPNHPHYTAETNKIAHTCRRETTLMRKECASRCAHPGTGTTVQRVRHVLAYFNQPCNPSQ